MAIQILMPALSPTMTEGKLGKWLKAEGDKIKSGDMIAEIETDKATMEFEAVDEGTLGKILVQAGAEGVAVNTPIAVLLQNGESKDAVANMKAPALRRLPRSRHLLRRPPPVAAAPVATAPKRRVAPRPSSRRCASRCATPWPRRCGAIPTSS